MLQLADAVLEFRQGTQERLAAFRVSVPDAGSAIARAKALGLEVSGTQARIGGVDIVFG
jgi:post-segregation antitoxin (ccd killing protein)